MPQSTDSSLFTKILNNFKSSKVKNPVGSMGLDGRLGELLSGNHTGKQQVLLDCS